MSFFGDLLKEKSLWVAIGGALAVYIGTIFLNRYYGPMNSNSAFLPDKTIEKNNTNTPKNLHLQKPDFILKPDTDYQAVISTEYGDIRIDLFEKNAPNIVNNFVYLANNGFYKNMYWHRIITNFLIQTGDPTGKGNGGPGYFVKGDFNSSLPDYSTGIVGMANDGNKNHNGSQFFIVASGADYKYMKDWKNIYPIFGRVISGMNIVNKIASIKANKYGKPSKLVKVYNIQIVEK